MLPERNSFWQHLVASLELLGQDKQVGYSFVPYGHLRTKNMESSQYVQTPKSPFQAVHQGILLWFHYLKITNKSKLL